MPVSDTNPERRNLILMSLAFIIFYAGGGKLAEDTMRLMFVNITFSKPYVLAYFAWAMLMWFCLRFWQKSGFKFWSSLTTEIVAGKMPQSIADYAEKKAKNQLQGANKIDHESKKIEAEYWHFEKYFIYIICNFQNNSNQVFHQEKIKYGGIKGFIFTTQKILTHSFKDNAFSEELMPYILFIIAIFSPIWSALIEQKV